MQILWTVDPKRSQFVLATILQMQALWSVTMLGSAQLGSARLGSAAAIGSRSARLGSARLFGSSSFCLHKRRSQFVLATILQMQALWSVDFDQVFVASEIAFALRLGQPTGWHTPRRSDVIFFLLPLQRYAASSYMQQSFRCKYCGLSTHL